MFLLVSALFLEAFLFGTLEITLANFRPRAKTIQLIKEYRTFNNTLSLYEIIIISL